MRRRHLTGALTAVGIAAALTAGTNAYSTYARWTSSGATFLVNPANLDVSSSAAVAALQAGMEVWNAQSGSGFRYTYGGPATDTATSLDYRNVVMFRNASSGSALASTYSWWNSSNQLLDSDIVFWDSSFKFFTGTSGCGSVSNAAYVEDVAAHEFGHALGLNHSSYTDATMYPSYGYCSQAFRTLAADDIAAARALYPATTAPTNTAPSVSIATPTNGISILQGTSLVFTGSSTDAEDGNLTGSVQWTDNGTSIGSGGSLARVLTLGSHTVVARVTDSGGLQASRQVTVTVTSSTGGSTPTLSARGRKVKGVQNTDLSWNGLSGTSIDVYRNNVKVMGTANDGTETDKINSKGSATYTYKVCAVGTTTCSNTASVVF
jgi:hypothetical protein